MAAVTQSACVCVSVCVDVTPMGHQGESIVGYSAWMRHTHCLILCPRAYYPDLRQAEKPPALCHLQVDVYCYCRGGRTHPDWNILLKAIANALLLFGLKA